MLGSGGKQKQGIVKGCLVPLLSIVGLVGVCYLLCLALFLLQPELVRATGG